MKGGHPISFQDKSFQCSARGTIFTFSAEEQEFFASKGYTNEPERCPSCREARKAEHYGSNSGYGYRPQRQMFPAKGNTKSVELPARLYKHVTLNYTKET